MTLFIIAGYALDAVGVITFLAMFIYGAGELYDKGVSTTFSRVISAWAASTVYLTLPLAMVWMTADMAGVTPPEVAYSGYVLVMWTTVGAMIGGLIIVVLVRGWSFCKKAFS
ncbi:hypothetical protein HN358_00220 [Candidatus Uhrbacteria bacterium]|jgi:hypothetical protein|nr:hypothetical protein [Candidatus Uhrbacteria bacterium]MBT7717274.1 hypothetical protein [Candidatus Uhrbacteria bacterium]